MDRAYLIGIAGPSGSGKTTLATALARRLPSVALLPLDSYYHDRAGLPESHIEVDIPQALEEGLIVNHLRHLAAGRAIERPLYDYATHTRATRGVQIAPAKTVIVDGLYPLFWDRVRELLDLGIFIDLDRDTCLARRIERDMRERGRDRESIVEMFNAKVHPNAERFVYPSKALADLVLDGNDPVEGWVETVIRQLEA